MNGKTYYAVLLDEAKLWWMNQKRIYDLMEGVVLGVVTG